MADRYDAAVEATRYIGPDWLARMLPRLGEASRIVDLGCANGALGTILRRRYPDAHCTGVDVSEKMIDRARARGIYDRLIVHDLDEPLEQLDDASAELVVALGFCEFLADTERLLDDVARILSVRGELLISFQEHRPDQPGQAPRTSRSGSIVHHACTAAEVSELITNTPLAIRTLHSETGYVSASGFHCPYLLVHALRQPG